MLDSLAAEEGIPGLLLTLDEDTADICAFTRAQRVPVMVVSVADTAVPQLRKSKDPLFLLAANGVAETFQFLSKDNAELLSVSAETRR